MKWFKHFHNARRSEKVGLILETMGVKGYGQWFILLEVLTEKIGSVENYQKNSVIRVRKRELRESLEVQRNAQLTQILKSLASCNVLCFSEDKFFASIECPILFELQDKHSKYNRKRVVSKSQGTTLDIDKEEDKEEEVDIDIDIYKHATEIINLWNFKDLKPMKLIPESLRKVSMAMNYRLKNGQGTDDIIRAIGNYSEVAKLNPPSWYTHRFDLRSFLMNETSDRFFDLEFKIELFLKQSHRVPDEAPRSKYAPRKKYAN